MVQSSLEIIFFKEMEVLVDEEMVLRWKPYFTITDGGLIDFIQGSDQVQVTGNETIDVWNIDKETLEPEKYIVMNNYFACTCMMYGPKSRYAITYKHGEIGFNIYSRAFLHKFLVQLDDSCYQDCVGMTLNHTD